jgi:hypothetical protein
MKRVLPLCLLLALTGCGKAVGSDSDLIPESQMESAQGLGAAQDRKSLIDATSKPMPPICVDAQQNRFAAEAMIGQSRDPDVGGVGFTGHTQAERELVARFNADILHINDMVGSIRGAAEDAMDAQGLPKDMMTRGASAIKPWILPNRHLQIDEIDEACTLFEGYKSERARKRAEAQAKLICAKLGAPTPKGAKDCFGPAFK